MPAGSAGVKLVEATGVCYCLEAIPTWR
jgi:hypothetical protein